MPGCDGTGPSGEGPMTGGGFGYCRTGWRSAYGPRSMGFRGRFGAGRGFVGFGGGLGRAYGRTYLNRMPWHPGWRPRAIAANTELATLQQEAEDVKAYLKDVETRIAELEKEPE